MDGQRTRFLLDGLVAGLIGYATVVVFFGMLNAVQGRPIVYTAALLGGHLFYGLESPADVVIAPGPVLAYNGIHLLVFILAGGVMAWLAQLGERMPQGWYLVTVLFLLVMAHMFGLPIWFSEPVRSEVPLWYVVIASSTAAMLMGAYLLAVHPGLRKEMGEYRDE